MSIFMHGMLEYSDIKHINMCFLFVGSPFRLCKYLCEFLPPLPLPDYSYVEMSEIRFFKKYLDHCF